MGCHARSVLTITSTAPFNGLESDVQSGIVGLGSVIMVNVSTAHPVASPSSL